MIEVVMPRSDLTTENGTIIRWFKAEGDAVTKGEPLLEVETAKVTMEVEAPVSGTLGKRIASEDQTIAVGQVIGYILSPGEEAPESWPMPTPPEIPAGESLVGNQKGQADQAMKLPSERDGISRQVRASPKARKLADQKGVELVRVEGHGPGGRITAQDVLEFLDTFPAAGQLIDPSSIQRVTAQRMTQSFTSAPHFYLTAEAIAARLVALRDTLLLGAAKGQGVRPTFTDMLTFLVARALQQHPRVNASWQQGKIRVASGINIGVAMAVDRGLVVPVVKDANRKDVFHIAHETKELEARANNGELTSEELSGGTFTLSNLGMFGVDGFQAIINPPQAAILAVGQIAERPVVEGGHVVGRPTVRLTLSLDHRVLDGAEGARFLADLKALVERPGELFDEDAR